MATRADSTKTIYWDACCFVSLIERHPERSPVLQSIADEAEKGRIKIHTSVLSIAEVAFAAQERAAHALEDEIEARINALWSLRSPFQLVEVFPAITYEARALMRRAITARSKVPKPSDAIHLAAAVRVKACEFHTYDENLQKAATGLSLPMDPCEPKTNNLVWRDE